MYAMKRMLQLLVLLSLVFHFEASAQNEPFLGMNYQGLARDFSGQLLTNQKLLVRLSFHAKDDVLPQNFYVEVHEVKTDNLGLFRFVIGKGQAVSGATMSEIPWASKNIWLDVETSTQGNSNFQLLSSTELQTVPYAFYAETTNRLIEDDSINLRSSSIYWTTGGNENTRPPYHFIGNRDDKDFVVKTNDTTRLVITSNGQVQLTGGPAGTDDKQLANYPLFITGAQHGIYIKVNGDRNNENNFLTFADGGPGIGDGIIWGRVEGQTVDELTNSDPFKRENFIFGLQLASLAADAAGTGVEAAGEYASATGAAASLIFAFAAPGIYAAAVANTAQAVTIGIEAAALATEVATFNSNSIANAGVYYTSGAGDYAEYIVREPDERDLIYGEIVGIHGGQVSLNTFGASHMMVVSAMPAFLGNATFVSDHENRERVAFMGQVPIRVVGPVQVGDYIIPSGNEDGMGIAVNPDELPAGQYHRIVGIAWEAADDAPLNIINCAVGLHKNKLAGKVQEAEDKVNTIMAYLQGKAELPNTQILKRPNMLDRAAKIQNGAYEGVLNEETFFLTLNQNENYIRALFKEMGNQLKAKGHDFDRNPGLLEFVNDPIAAYKKMWTDPQYRGVWKYLNTHR